MNYSKQNVQSILNIINLVENKITDAELIKYINNLIDYSCNDEQRLLELANALHEKHIEYLIKKDDKNKEVIYEEMFSMMHHFSKILFRGDMNRYADFMNSAMN